MRSKRLILVVLSVVVFTVSRSSIQLVQSKNSDTLPTLENPIRTSDEDEIQNLPGLNDPVNFRQFSGYLNADDTKDKPKKFFHYWFVESQSNPSKDPVLLWLNGGPGCSSLGGLFTELGPFSVNDDGSTLKLNDYSWNKVANVLFLESPASVGFSYSKSLINVHTDDTTARENYLALKSFFQKFPQYKNNSLYLSGESYAGVYLPTLGELVDADKEFNLKGIAIGNGYLDTGKLSDSLVFFTYYHGLVGKTAWDAISEYCCDGKPPSRTDCNLSGSKSSVLCRFEVTKLLFVLNLSGLNPYNVYGKCLQPPKESNSIESFRRVSTKEVVDKKLRNLGFESNILKSHRAFHLFQANHTEHEKLHVEPPCFDDHTLINYLNNKEVRKAIHIPEAVPAWDTCSAILYVMKYAKLPGGLTPQVKSLINSKRNLTLLVYNGDVDSVCNFLGDEWFVDDLGRDVIRDYTTWKVNKQVAGFVKHYDGITFATIRGSGHMVPGDKPREAYEMIKLFLNSTSHNVYL